LHTQRPWAFIYCVRTHPIYRHYKRLYFFIFIGAPFRCVIDFRLCAFFFVKNMRHRGLNALLLTISKAQGTHWIFQSVWYPLEKRSLCIQRII